MFLPYARMMDFAGRSCRREYWSFMLLQVLVGMVMGIGVAMASAVISAPFLSSAWLTAMLGNASLVIASVIYLLFFLLPQIALTVRRWHDIGNSGWTIVVLMVIGAIPYIGFLAGIIHIFAMCTPGDKNANQYGPNPASTAGNKANKNVYA
ncbi:DUF805 domain-containing protein [Sphingorhabdus arenilitoris]|uniref:DUF805 domain-containing protein n=1 Tax=Sphingorhabdus arenilitoris TaxID=1490041 RepID=A0ABV8RJ15_9SPHN